VMGFRFMRMTAWGFGERFRDHGSIYHAE
jgi:hypothetical protein